jgi:hypothetical protein
LCALYALCAYALCALTAAPATAQEGPPPDPPPDAPVDPTARPEDAWDNPPLDAFDDVDEVFEDEPLAPPPLTPPELRVGFGFGFQPLTLNNAALLLPIDISHLRVELGFLLTYDRRVGNSPSRSETESALEMIGNLGLFYITPLSELTSFYAGLRAGISWRATTFESRDTASASTRFIEDASGFGFHFSPVIAGEYYLWPALALALELQLDLAYYPEDSVTPPQSARLATSNLTFGTNGALMVRWFF